MTEWNEVRLSPRIHDQHRLGRRCEELRAEGALQLDEHVPRREREPPIEAVLFREPPQLVSVLGRVHVDGDHEHIRSETREGVLHNQLL